MKFSISAEILLLAPNVIVDCTESAQTTSSATFQKHPQHPSLQMSQKKSLNKENILSLMIIGCNSCNRWWHDGGTIPWSDRHSRWTDGISCRMRNDLSEALAAQTNATLIYRWIWYEAFTLNNSFSFDTLIATRHSMSTLFHSSTQSILRIFNPWKWFHRTIATYVGAFMHTNDQLMVKSSSNFQSVHVAWKIRQSVNDSYFWCFFPGYLSKHLSSRSMINLQNLCIPYVDITTLSICNHSDRKAKHSAVWEVSLLLDFIIKRAKMLMRWMPLQKRPIISRLASHSARMIYMLEQVFS